MKALFWSLLFIASLGLTACGDGLQSKLGSCTDCVNPDPNNGSSGNNGGGNNNQQPDKIPDDIVIDGEINGGVFDKVSVIELDKDNKMVILRLPLAADPVLLSAYARIDIPQIPGAMVTIDSLNPGSLVFSVHLPLDVFLDGLDTIEPGTLPNGDPLPQIAGGELPKLGLKIHENDETEAYLYLGANNFGVFVTTPFNPFIYLTFPIRNKDKTETMGYFTVVPEKNGFDGGFFTSMKIPDELARILEDCL